MVSIYWETYGLFFEVLDCYRGEREIAWVYGVRWLQELRMIRQRGCNPKKCGSKERKEKTRNQRKVHRETLTRVARVVAKRRSLLMKSIVLLEPVCVLHRCFRKTSVTQWGEGWKQSCGVKGRK